jgi:hypothetical protein
MWQNTIMHSRLKEKSPVLENMSHSARLLRYRLVDDRVSRLTDAEIAQLLNQGKDAHSGIGGTAVSLLIDGIPVFAKRVPLTDLERTSENVMSTRNLFGLPGQFHYGIVSLGFGVWRELAAHSATTKWVLSQQCESFPLLYHSRVLENQPRRVKSAELDEEVSTILPYWRNSAPVKLRLEEIESATAEVVLFLEHLPQNLFEWLNDQLATGDDAVSSACDMVERNLRSQVPFMSANGFLHLDAHSKNILTDGHCLYFTDFGLSMFSEFELSTDEVRFFELNRIHDLSHTISQLVNWLVTNFGVGISDIAGRNEFIARCARGNAENIALDSAAVIIRRYAPIATVFNTFYRELFIGNYDAPFPAEELRRAWDKADNSLISN